MPTLATEIDEARPIADQAAGGGAGIDAASCRGDPDSRNLERSISHWRWPGSLPDDDRNRNSPRRSSGPRWHGGSARWAIRGWRWISRAPAAWVLLWHGSANGAGHRPDNGSAQCPLGIFAISATLRRRSAHGCGHRRVGFDCGLSDSPFHYWPRPSRPAARLRCLSRHHCRDGRLSDVARWCEGWERAEASLGLGNSRGGRWRCGLRVLRSRWSFHRSPAIDGVFRIAAIRGPRSRPGARVPQRIHCVAGLCRDRSGRLGCRITACAWWNGRDLRWSRVCHPPARETDAVGVLRTLAAYRGAAGAAGVIEVRYGFEESAGRTIPQGM